MFKVTTREKYENDFTPTNTTTSKIPLKWRPFVMSGVYILLLFGASLLINAVLEVTFNETKPYQQPFYFSIFITLIFSFLLPYVPSEKKLEVEESLIHNFKVEKVKASHNTKSQSTRIIIAKFLTFMFTIGLFYFSYSTNKKIDKYETVTIHNIPIRGVDSVQIAVRMSRNTKDSATPGRFKIINDAKVSNKKDFIYEEYSYGFPYELLVPEEKELIEEGKKYLNGKRAKIYVKWYGDEISTKQVKGGLKTVLSSEAMNNLLLASFGEAYQLEENTKKRDD